MIVVFVEREASRVGFERKTVAKCNDEWLTIGRVKVDTAKTARRERW